MHKTIKKIITIISSITLMAMTTVPAQAAEIDRAKVVETGVNVSEAAQSGYEASVVSRMAGRCGSATPTGAKGIAFEVVYSDIRNFENAFLHFGEGIKTKFTKCPNASDIDLITIDKTGKVLERIQCKDTPSQSATKQVINRVKMGQYRSAQLVGTKEAAEAFNSMATKNGLSKIMKDSGISSKYTKQIADRALGNTSNIVKTMSQVGKATAIATVISGGFAFFEAKEDGLDAYDTTAHVVTKTTEDAIIASSTTAIACTATDALAAIGVGSAITAITPVVICCGSSIIMAYIVEGIANKTNVEEIVSKYLKIGHDTINKCIDKVSVYIDEADLPEKWNEFSSIVKEKTSAVVEVVKVEATDIRDVTVKKYNEIVN